ncbi:MAG: hypothetical protein AAFY72_06135, partial [Cyanobacteria bacterium J06649_4]
EFAQKNYGKDKQVGDRIKGALDTRLYRLTSQSGVAKMFRSVSQLPLDELMKKPIVFELGGLNEEEQALFSLFILTFIFEHIRTERVGKFSATEDTEERATDLNLRHVLLVEEAHNILGRHDNGMGSNSQKKVIDKFAQIMREMRAAGEGVLIVDQSPAALSQSIVDATNIKLMHRLPSPDDREYLGRAMCLSEGETDVSGIFSAGQGFYYVPGWDRAQRVDTTNFKEANREVRTALETAMPDREVAKAMESQIKRLFAMENDLSQQHSVTAEKELFTRSENVSFSQDFQLSSPTSGREEQTMQIEKRIATLLNVLEKLENSSPEVKQKVQSQISEEKKKMQILRQKSSL